MNKHVVAQTVKFRSHGKLMISGEYLVLKGAIAFALPCKDGQTLEVEPIVGTTIFWSSYDQNGRLWFQGRFSMEEFTVLESEDMERAGFISQLLQSIFRVNPVIFTGSAFHFKTRLEFNKDFGLGSSSTLIYNLAQWASVDAFQLLDNTLGGSGYDIAVAETHRPTLYQKLPIREYEPVVFDPPFSAHIFFIYLNRKEDSAAAVAQFQKNESDYEIECKEISKISQDIVKAVSLRIFERRIEEHNIIMSNVLKVPHAQSCFSEYTGGILKFLGAWGGDFMLATGTNEDMNFFREKGFKSIYSFADMIHTA